MPEYSDTYPNVCEEVGLTCETCTSNTGRELARVCKGLRGKALGQMFVQLYPHPACSKSHGNFAQAYRDASPRPAMSETFPVTIAAVA
jgi:hypothetical protein